MTTLQRAFSRHEKIRRMLANLEELKKNGEVDADKYTQLKTQYEVLLGAAYENLKAIRNQIKEQRQQAQETLDRLQADASIISTRGKVGELAPEKVAAELGAIQSKKDACTKSVQQYDGWLKARSSTDVGGYVDVDANETIEYRPESVLDWGRVVGNIGERAKGLVGEKVAGSVTGLVEHVYEMRKGAGGSNLKKRLPTIVGVCVGVLLVVFLGYKMLGKRPSIPTLNEKTMLTSPSVSPKQYTQVITKHDVETALPRPMTDGQAAASCAACGGGFLFVIIAALAINIAILVWVARDAKARGMDSSVIWMLLVFFAGLLGLVIYLLSRPKGNVVSCPSCNNKRLQASAKCPHCGNP